MRNKSFVILVIAIVGMLVLTSSIAIASPENVQYREVISREKVRETLYGDEVWKVTWSDGTESTEITTPLMTRILRSLRLQTVFGEPSSETETVYWGLTGNQGTLEAGDYTVTCTANRMDYQYPPCVPNLQVIAWFNSWKVYKNGVEIYDATHELGQWITFDSPASANEDWGFTCDGGRFTFKLRAIPQYSQPEFIADGWTQYHSIDQIKVEVTYPGATGNISVNSDPTGAEVYINDNYITTTPDTITSVPAGTYAIKMVKAGYQDWTESVTVVQDETVPVSATLTSDITPPPDVRPNPIAELIQWIWDWIKGIFSKF